MDPVDAAMQRIARARAARSAREVATLYRDWAADYDADVFGAAEVTGTDRIADLLAEHVAVADRSAPVIDLGCGTGVAGVRLRRHGFAAVDGVDLSSEMLAIAATKGAYRSLVAADLNRPLPLRDSSYAAAVSAGTFRTGHVGAGAVPGILAVLRPGAVIAWTIAEWTPFAALAAGWDILHLAREPFRRGGDAEMTMLVARVRGGSRPGRRSRPKVPFTA